MDKGLVWVYDDYEDDKEDQEGELIEGLDCVRTMK